MGKRMIWMFEHPVEETNAKGQKVIKTDLRLEPLEGARKVYVQYHTPKEKKGDKKSIWVHSFFITGTVDETMETRPWS